MEVEIQEVD